MVLGGGIEGDGDRVNWVNWATINLLAWAVLSRE